MAEHFTVVDFDHRGYGLSDRPDQPYDIGVWSNELVAMLDALSIEKAHVHGGSMGAFIAVDFAVNYPDRVDRLILGGGAAKSGYWAQCMFRIWQDLATAYGVTSDALIRAILVTGFSQPTLDEPGFGDGLVEGMRGIISRNVTPAIFQQACQAMIDYDVRDRLDRITRPTLVMVGSEDNLTPLHQEPSGAGMQYIVDHITGAELSIVPNSATRTSSNAQQSPARSSWTSCCATPSPSEPSTPPRTEQEPDMPTVNVNGADIWYQLTGSGPYLVQISGAVSGHEAYGPLTPLMAEHFTVIDYDHRGYGFSDRPVQRYDVDVWADDLVAMLDALGVGKTHVHGGSMGAFIAVNFAVKYPDRVDRLILGGGPPSQTTSRGVTSVHWQNLARAMASAATS